jgi:Ca2+-binding RTX toxin-like protein
MGNQDAVTVLNWESNFLVGRFLSADQGINPFDGFAYGLITTDASANNYTTWSQIQQATIAAGLSNNGGVEGGDFAELALQSVAGVITVTGSTDAMRAYGWLQANVPASYLGNNAQFAIAPRLSDGHLLTQDNIHISQDTTATTITGTNNDQLLYAGSGNDTLIGGSGINLLFAGSGNDVLQGGANNDFLFGGSGTARLYAAGGTNFLRGGTGADTFVFHAVDQATDTVQNFKASTDHLEIQLAIADNRAASDVIAAATTDAAGDAVLHLGAGHDVILSGVTVQHLSAGWFVITH